MGWGGVGWGWDVNVPVSLENLSTIPQYEICRGVPQKDVMQFCKKHGPCKKNAGTQCIDRQWQSLKKNIPKDLCNKHKLTEM